MLQADLLVALGVRFDDRVTGKLETFAQRATIVHIDIDTAEIGKNKVGGCCGAGAVEAGEALGHVCAIMRALAQK